MRFRYNLHPDNRMLAGYRQRELGRAATCKLR